MLARVSEDLILKKIKSWCEKTQLPSTMLGIGDDAAAVFPSGRPLFFCSDFTIEETHFSFQYSTPEDVAFKSLARPLSDIAAMGGEPLGTTISIALPRSWTSSEVDRFLESYFKGATEFSRLYQTPLLGGDLSRTDGSLVIDVAAIGQLRSRGSVWRRSGARPGDLAVVTGPLGAASFALSEMREGRRDKLPQELTLKHLRPRPRFDVGKTLSPHPVNAAIDISDGLIRDASRLCTESLVSLELSETQIPGTETYTSSHALSGGDDYELLLAISPIWARSEEGRAELEKLGATIIGEFKTISGLEKPQVYFESTQTNPAAFEDSSHDPFRDTSRNP